MKLLFVNSIANNTWGGGEKWMLTAALGLKHRGHQVWMGCRADSILGERAWDAGLNVLPLPIAGDLNPLLVAKLIRFLKQEKIQILIPNLIKDIRTAGLAGRLAGTPLILARQGLVLCKNEWKYKVVFQHLTDAIIVNSQGTADTYHSFGWFKDNQIHLVYNGVHLSDEIVERADNKNPIIFSAGRLDPQKNFPMLLKAALLAKTENKPWEFVIAGDGPERSILENMIDNLKLTNVKLIGFQEDLKIWFEKCDLFALPSRFEGMPNVIMEAMAAAKPVVATDLPGIRDLMIHGTTGLLVENDNTRDFFKAIEHILESKDQGQSMGRAGRKHIEAQFSIETMLDNLESLFHRLGVA